MTPWRRIRSETGQSLERLGETAPRRGVAVVVLPSAHHPWVGSGKPQILGSRGITSRRKVSSQYYARPRRSANFRKLAVWALCGSPCSVRRQAAGGHQLCDYLAQVAEMLRPQDAYALMAPVRVSPGWACGRSVAGTQQRRQIYFPSSWSATPVLLINKSVPCHSLFK